jgi:hypothetical protein
MPVHVLSIGVLVLTLATTRLCACLPQGLLERTLWMQELWDMRVRCSMSMILGSQGVVDSLWSW